MQGWSRNRDYKYPEDFSIKNEVKIYTCKESGKRIIISNGIPDHNVRQANPNIPCATNWAVTMPLNPSVASSVTEIPTRGAIAMAVNGVPAYGPQEGNGSNAVEPSAGSPIQDAKFWYGHADMQKAWHFHNPYMGANGADSDTLLGYAFDGFPIYGPLSDSSNLDACNGIEINGKYQYHVVATNEVNEGINYCNGNNAANNWNYILGCYRGSISTTQVTSSTSFNIPSDCTTSTSDCTDKSDMFYIKMNKSGQPMLRNCDWLAKSSNKSSICKNKVTYYENGSDSYSPAQDVCQAICESCDACFENKKSRFYKNKKNGKVKTKTCTWLSKLKASSIRKNCAKTMSGGGYSPASLQCPVTCGVDSCAAS